MSQPNSLELTSRSEDAGVEPRTCVHVDDFDVPFVEPLPCPCVDMLLGDPESLDKGRARVFRVVASRKNVSRGAVGARLVVARAVKGAGSKALDVAKDAFVGAKDMVIDEGKRKAIAFAQVASQGTLVAGHEAAGLSCADDSPACDDRAAGAVGGIDGHRGGRSRGRGASDETGEEREREMLLHARILAGASDGVNPR